MNAQECPFADVPGFAAMATQCTTDYEYMGVVIWDIKTNLKFLCVVRRPAHDRAGAEYSPVGSLSEIPRELRDRFCEYSPTVVSDEAKIRKLLVLPPVMPQCEREEQGESRFFATKHP